MEAAELELERRSKFLNSLIVKKKADERQEQTDRFNVRVRAADMPYALQSRAFRCARDHLTSTPGKLDSKRLALTLKKEFDSSYGPAWHCIVGTSFGSFVTHSLGGFLYFSIDKRPNRGRYLRVALRMAKGSEAETIGESAEARPLHDALFLVLSYLPVFELLSVAQVCRSLRDAVNTDVLPWLDFLVERPLSSRLTDKFLKKLTSRSKGRVRVLALIDCDKITDDGLRQVLDDNPLVGKLWIPGCTSLTPEGVVEAVKKLSLKSLIINGVYNIKKHHVEALQSHFQQNSSHNRQQPHLHYHSSINFQTLIKSVDLPSIDVEICPRCNEIVRVYGCPKKVCRRGINCRACIYCIPRCEECGGCVEGEEEDVETACSDTLCSDCWLILPKCSFCNKPYCKRHACLISSEEPEFLCSSCHERFVENFNHHIQ